MTAPAAARSSLAYKPVGARERAPGMPHRCIADVSVDSRDRIRVYSRDNQAVFVLDLQGKLIARWKSSADGELGTPE